jgi:hypothetical protein
LSEIWSSFEILETEPSSDLTGKIKRFSLVVYPCPSKINDPYFSFEGNFEEGVRDIFENEKIAPLPGDSFEDGVCDFFSSENRFTC